LAREGQARPPANSASQTAAATSSASAAYISRAAPKSWHQYHALKAGSRASKATSPAHHSQNSPPTSQTLRKGRPHPSHADQAVRSVAIKREEHPGPSVLETHLARCPISTSTSSGGPSGVNPAIRSGGTSPAMSVLSFPLVPNAIMAADPGNYDPTPARLTVSARAALRDHVSHRPNTSGGFETRPRFGNVEHPCQGRRESSHALVLWPFMFMVDSQLVFGGRLRSVRCQARRRPCLSCGQPDPAGQAITAAVLYAASFTRHGHSRPSQRRQQAGLARVQRVAPRRHQGGVPQPAARPRRDPGSRPGVWRA
jgi:hypothetical protein